MRATLRIGLTIAAFLVAAVGVAHAQAEPAPGDPVPAATLNPPPKWRVAVHPRLAVRTGDNPAGLPRIGYGAGVQVFRALVDVGPLRFGLAADFAYDRFSQFHSTGSFGQPPGEQALSHSTFAISAVFDGIFGQTQRWRPWIAAGPALSIGTYEDSQMVATNSVHDVSALPVLKVQLGLGFRVYQSMELGLHAEYDVVFTGPSGGTPAKPLYEPGWFVAGLDIGFRV